MRLYKNIIFDLGGVLLDIDYQKTANAFIALGAADFNHFYSQSTANKLFEDLETGHISDVEFYKNMEQYCTPGTTHSQIMYAWNALLLNFRKESLEYLKILQPHYQLFLLSNTNYIHHQAFEHILHQQIGIPSLAHYFTKAIYSHEIKKRKPYESTYKYVLETLDIKAGDTLFIDDSPINIPGAKNVGLHTHLLLPSERIEQLGLL